ncbi:MAG: class IV adenylate cyclase [Desulfovibrio sp.]|nr:class IV adenylate cyclase [Desulfovibrio sp.]
MDFSFLEAQLEAEGADNLGWVFERNLVFETTPPSLHAQGKLLRLRANCTSTDVHYLTTLKLQARANTQYKICEELEVVPTSGQQMNAFLLGLGYHVFAKYEKFRCSYRLGTVKIDLDILPFGRFVELEGGDLAVIASKLGLQAYKTSVASYHELHKNWQAAHGQSFEPSFVFSDSELHRLCALLGIVLNDATLQF